MKNILGSLCRFLGNRVIFAMALVLPTWASAFVYAPTASPTSSTRFAPFTVTLSSFTTGATIFYTTDGTDPQASATRTQYASPVSIATFGSTNLRARATAGVEWSSLSSFSYTLAVAAPTASIANNTTLDAPFTVTLTSSTPGTTIFYTTDGTDPQTSATRTAYSAPVSITAAGTTNLRARATTSGQWSSQSSFNYTLAVAAPTFSPFSHTWYYFYNPGYVTVTTTTPDVSMYYTVDGSTPTTASTPYTGPIYIDSPFSGNTRRIRVIATKSGLASTLAEATYYVLTAGATFSPASGTVTNDLPITVSLSTITEGATIHYTLDNTTPTTASPVYTGPITIDSVHTADWRAVRALVVRPPMASTASGATYYLRTAAPVASHAAGSYGAPINLTLSSATPGANLYYTLNNTTPTTSSTPYTGPVNIYNLTAPVTVRVLAQRPGFGPAYLGPLTYSFYFGAPVISLTSRVLEAPQPVTLTATPGTTIRYTLDGSDPSPTSTVYTEPLLITGTTLLRARAFDTSGNASQIASAQYTFAPMPLPATGLEMWLRADMGTIDNPAYTDETISTWLDMSGNGYVASQSNHDNQPIQYDSGPGGQPTVFFDGGRSSSNRSAYMDLSSGFRDFTQGMTFFLVTKPIDHDGFESWNPFFKLGNGDLEPNMILLTTNDPGHILGLWYYNNVTQSQYYNARQLNASGYMQWGNLSIIGFRHLPNRSYTIYRNNTPFVTGTQDLPVVATRTRGNIAGAPSSAGHKLKAEISELIIYNRALSDAERVAVENYLSDRYLAATNAAPVIEAVPAQTAPAGVEWTYQLVATDADAGQTLSYVLQPGAPTGMSLSSTGLLTWTPDGAQVGKTLYFTVRVTDNGSPAKSALQTVRIFVDYNNQPPQFYSISDQTVLAGAILSLTAEAFDPDGPASGLRYYLDSPLGGAWIDINSGLFTWDVPTDFTPGFHTVSLRVEDSGTPIKTGHTQFQVEVIEVDLPPVITHPGNLSWNENTAQEFTIDASDPNSTPNPLLYAFDASVPEGMAIDANTGRLTWTTDEYDGGSAVDVTIRVTEDSPEALSSTTTFTIHVSEDNQPPSLAPLGTYEVSELDELSIPLNASDPDYPAQDLSFAFDEPDLPDGLSLNGATLVWTPTRGYGPQTYTFKLRASDGDASSEPQAVQITVNETDVAPVLSTENTRPVIAELAPWTTTVEGQDPNTADAAVRFTLEPGAPAGVTIDPDTGILSWTPSEDQDGYYWIVVRGTEQTAAGLSTTLTIEAYVDEVNQNPNVEEITAQQVAEGDTWTFSVVASDLDLPAQTLAYELVSPTPSADLTIDEATGQLAWTPVRGDGPMSYTVTIRVTDSEGGSTDEAFSLHVLETDLPPTVVNLPAATVDELTTFSAQVEASDPNTAHAALTYAFEPGAPDGLAIDPNSGAISWLPTEAQGPGLYRVTVRVTEQTAAALFTTVPLEITVREVNSRPVLAPVGDQELREGTLWSIDLNGSDSDLPAQSLTYTVTVFAGPIPVLTLNSATGDFSWTPVRGDGPRTYSATIRLADTGSPALFTEQTITVNVLETDLPPVFAPVGSANIDELSPWTQAVTASDVNTAGAAMTYSLESGAPAGMSIDPNTGLISWTPGEADGPQSYAVGIRATERTPAALSTVATLNLAVREVNSAPNLATADDVTIPEGTTWTLPLVATDGDLPAQGLTYAITSPTPPAGLTVNPATGVVSWNPAEAQGPGVYPLTFEVRDNSSPALADSMEVTVTVAEVNQAPVIAPIAAQNLTGGNVASFTAIATDGDLPAQTLSFRLGTGALPGMTLDSSTGAFSWSVPRTLASQTVNVEVIADDNGEPVLTGSRTVSLNVDNAGPTITALTYQGAGFVDLSTVTTAGSFAVSANDPAGVSRVAFKIERVDGETVTEVSASLDTAAPFVADFDPSWLDDGLYRLTVTAFDSYNLSTERVVDFQLVLALPPAPVITEPTANRAQPVTTLSLAGNAPRGLQVVLERNGTAVGEPLSADSNGAFGTIVPLVSGTNELQTFAINKKGRGPGSNIRVIEVDGTVPDAPVGVLAARRADGWVRLTWSPPPSSNTAGYTVYGSTRPFTALNEPGVTRLSPALIRDVEAQYRPDADGAWYYRVTATNTAGTEGLASAQVSAESDRTPPTAVVRWTHADPTKLKDGRLGRGLVNVELEVNEPLSLPPFLSLAPQSGGANVVVGNLAPASPTLYRGTVIFDAATPTGVAQAQFVGRDLAGNRGTAVSSGGTVVIDTRGPRIVGLTVAPVEPIHNTGTAESPLTITAQFTLDEAPVDGSTPTFGWYLEALPGHADAESVSVVPVGSDRLTWTGTFALPAAAGSTAQAEFLRFAFSAIDDLNNDGRTILPENRFEVYQGELPGLEPPSEIYANALPAGSIAVRWTPSAHAEVVGYRLFRSAPGGTEPVDSFDYMEPDLTEVIDTPATDGTYRYWVATLRGANGQIGVSDRGAGASAVSDRVPPAAPTSLEAALTPVGIRLTWEGTPPVSGHRVYRATTAAVPLASLTPLLTTGPDLTAVDPVPTSPAFNYYRVTALDAVGNESGPSNEVLLSVNLLPVRTLEVTVEGEAAPVVSWSAMSHIDGYNVYVGAAPSRTKLNAALLPGAIVQLQDNDYAGGDRLYTVETVDSSGTRQRSLLLQDVEVILPADQRISRGLMNAVEFDVTNRSTQTLTRAVLKAMVAGRSHQSAPFSLAPGETKAVAVTIAGYQEIAGDRTPVAFSIEWSPNANERVTYRDTGEVAVDDSGLVLELLPGEFTAGATGTLSFRITNPGDEMVEIVTGTHSGSSPSPELTLQLLSSTGEPLGSPFHLLINSAAAGQFFPQDAPQAGIWMLPNGEAVLRLPGRAQFTSSPISVPVPLAAGPEIGLQLSVASVYSHRGQPQEVKMSGLTSRDVVTAQDEVSLVRTTYAGRITGIVPPSSTGYPQVINISGEALARAADGTLGARVPSARLRLGIRNAGFERTFLVTTDENGVFQYTFAPLAGESGHYTVYLSHPDLNQRDVQGSFVLQAITVSPGTVNVTAPRNFDQSFSVHVRTGSGTSATNLRLVPTTEVPSDVVFSLPAPITMGGSQDRDLSLTVRGLSGSPSEGSVNFLLVSDERPVEGWTTLRVNFAFSEPRANLSISPASYVVETGVTPGGQVSETVTIRSSGLVPVRNLRLNLVSLDGSSERPRLPWASLASASTRESLAVGEAIPAILNFSPTASVPEGDYYFRLRVESDNVGAYGILIHVAVTTNERGNAFFKVQNFYTGFGSPETNSQFYGLPGARIQLQNERVPTISFAGTTDANGECDFLDTNGDFRIPAGRYKYQITADGHDSRIGSITVRPASTVLESVLLQNRFVTVQWEVVPITIEDRYEIVLNAKFQTFVPAPVVIIEPAIVNVPPSCEGTIRFGEFRVTNHGLIRAEDIQWNLPRSDEYLTIQYLVEPPDYLDAQESVVIPYRMITRKPFPDTCEEEPGECWVFNYRSCITADYSFRCANGDRAGGSANGCFGYYDSRPCPPSQRPAQVGGGGGGGGGGGWGGGGGAAPLSGTWCGGKPCNPEEETGSSVHTLAGTLSDSSTDILGYVPGNTLEIVREYGEEGWRFKPPFGLLVFTTDRYREPDDQLVEIEYLGLKFKKTAGYFRSGYMTIRRQGEGWKMTTESSPTWYEFDKDGRPTRAGIDSLVLAQMYYTPLGSLDRIEDGEGDMVLDLSYEPAAGDERVVRIDSNSGASTEYVYNAKDQLARYRDALGVWIDYTYDAKGRIVRKASERGAMNYEYHPTFGYLTSAVDDQGTGKYFEFTYSPGQRQRYFRSTESTGKVTETFYGSDGSTERVVVDGVKVLERQVGENVVVETDSLGNRVTTQIVDSGRGTIRLDEVGRETRRRFDGRTNRILSETNSNGLTTEYQYDGNGNLTRTIKGAGTLYQRVSEYTYNPRGLLVQAVDKGGPVYDQDGQPVLDENGVPMVAEDRTQTFEYDMFGRVIAREEMGYRVEQVYDAYGFITENYFYRVGDARGAPTDVYEYDPVTGLLLSQKHIAGGELTYRYDNYGRVVSMRNREGAEITYSYPSPREAVIRYSGSDGEARIFRDSHGDTVKVIDVDGAETRYERDRYGRIIRVIDANGNIRQNAWADNSIPYQGKPSRLRTRSYHGATDEFEYNASGDVTKVTTRFDDGLVRVLESLNVPGSLVELARNNAGETYENIANIFGDVVSERLFNDAGAAATVSTAVYDAHGEIRRLTDGAGQHIYYHYDAAGRLLRKVMPNGVVDRYEYLHEGSYSIERRILPDNTKIDALFAFPSGLFMAERVIRPDGTEDVSQRIDFEYDASGRLLRMVGSDHAVVYSHDALGQTLEESFQFPAFTARQTFTRLDTGLRGSFTGADGITYTYAYDKLGNLVSIASPEMGAISISGHELSTATRWTFPGGMTVTHNLSSQGRPTRIEAKLNSTVFFAETAQYDAFSRMTDRTTEDHEQSFAYDIAGNLSVVKDKIAGLWYENTRSYDAANNLVYRSDVGDWIYEDGNQLVSHPNATYTYGDRGEVVGQTVGGDVWSYAYDARGRMTRVEKNGSFVAAYGYDYFSRRIWKETSAGRTYFTYDGDALVGEFNASGQVLTTYGQHPGWRDGVNPLFIKRGGQYAFFVNNVMGAPVMAVTDLGQILWKVNYDVDWNTTVAVADWAINLRGSNQYFDSETGWHYNTHRYYNPASGRYMQQDPIRENGGLNTFSFVQNNPLNLVDTLGLSSGSCKPEKIKILGQEVCFILGLTFNLAEARWDFPTPTPLTPASVTEAKLSGELRVTGKICPRTCCPGTGLLGLGVDVDVNVCVNGNVKLSVAFYQFKFKGPGGVGELKGGFTVEGSGTASLSVCLRKLACSEDYCVAAEAQVSASVFGGFTMEAKLGGAGDKNSRPLAQLLANHTYGKFGVSVRARIGVEVGAKYGRGVQMCSTWSEPKEYQIGPCLFGQIFADIRIKVERGDKPYRHEKSTKNDDGKEIRKHRYGTFPDWSRDLRIVLLKLGDSAPCDALDQNGTKIDPYEP